MTSNMKKITGFVALLLAAPLAEAHTGLLQNGFMSGLSHPLLGLDHLLAMLAVGLWAGKLGGRASWSFPLLFILILSVSAIGSNSGVEGLGTALWLENGIAVSLLLLGLLLVFTIKLPVLAGLLLVSLFAVFHGVAHGTEWPLAASPLVYAAGFVISTALVLAAGVKAGTARQERLKLFIKIAGVLIASTGGWMLLAN